MMGDMAFVPDGASRTDTAILLVGTATEFGISQRDIRATTGGFYISAALADVIYSEPEPVKKAPTKTSGNRAAKNNNRTSTAEE